MIQYQNRYLINTDKFSPNIYFEDNTNNIYLAWIVYKYTYSTESFMGATIRGGVSTVWPVQCVVS